jgi:transposase
MKKEITKDVLVKLYCHEKKRTRQIAKELGIGKSTVIRLMTRYSILARPRKTRQ